MLYFRHRHIVACFFSLLIVGATAQAGPGTPPNTKNASASQLAALAQKSGLPDRSLAVAALPLDGPGDARAINADTPVNPGSTMKLVTTYAAMELLGPTFKWHTRVYTDGELEGSTLKGNLYLVGDGDPRLNEDRVRRLLRELRAYGIKDIEGDLVVDDSYFLLPDGQPEFNDDGGNPHAAFLVEPYSALTNWNVQLFRARADNNGVRTWMEPHLDKVMIDNQIRFKTTGRCPSSYQFRYEPNFHDNGKVTVSIHGTLPRGCKTGKYLSLLPASDYTLSLVRSLWRELGGSISGASRRASRPSGTRLLSTSSSRDLVSVVRDINKWSNNVMARQLYLTIGAENRTSADKDDLAAADRAIRDWLKEKGIEIDNIVLENGSGLSRIERISARQLARLLEQAWQSPYAAELIASLPLVAMDGTMRRRLRKTDLVGQGHIKTGSLRNVRSIAGFTRDSNNTTWAVVAIVNHNKAWKAEAVLDGVLKQVRLAGKPDPITTASRTPQSD